MRSTTAEPTTTPSATAATAAASAAVLMPNPTATGAPVTARMVAMRSPATRAGSKAAPVTPVREM